MINRDHLKALTDALRPVMNEQSFQRKELTWYRYSSETVELFDIQEAMTGSNPQRIYFNMGVILRKSNPPTHFSVFECTVYGRLDRLVPESERLAALSDFADSSHSLEERINGLVGIVTRFALPILDTWRTVQGLTAFIRSDSSKGFVKKLDKVALEQKL